MLTFPPSYSTPYHDLYVPYQQTRRDARVLVPRKQQRQQLPKHINNHPKQTSTNHQSQQNQSQTYEIRPPVNRKNRSSPNPFPPSAIMMPQDLSNYR
eukprot:UN03182